SKVWEDFSLVKRKSDNKMFDNIAACNHCLIVVSHIDANTSSMIRHECKHESSKPMKLTQFPGVLQPVSLPEEHRRTLVDGCVKLSAAIPGIGFATHRSEAMLEFIQMIIDVTTKVGRPWDAAKSIPSDTTISRKCKEVAAERRELVKNKIKAQRPPYQVHFDAWLNPYQNRHLLGITVNLHNGDHSRPALLALQELPSETAADVLATTNDVLSKYELDGKSILFSTDSASNNIAALNEGDLASTPCFAHLIQLAIKCGTCPKQE
ncbi:hypothetical protein FOZ63_014556, partial [Perkinsus olseni]